MQWRWAETRERELILVDFTEDERANAAWGIAQLREACKHGETTGGRLHLAVEGGRLPWKVIQSLSRWCNSEGKYESGVEPARVVSRALFNKRILPRLTEFRGDGVTEAIALQRFAQFAETAGIMVDRSLIQEQDRTTVCVREDGMRYRQRRNQRLRTNEDLFWTTRHSCVHTAIEIWPRHSAPLFLSWPIGQHWSGGCLTLPRLSVLNWPTPRYLPLSIECRRKTVRVTTPIPTLCFC